MKIIADLHFHSKYSRAVSQQMVLPEIARWAQLKGVNLLTTTDFTHPLWLRELKVNLEEAGEGIYRLKTKDKEAKSDGPFFLFTTEISSIYTQAGKLRRIHNIVFAPNLEEAEKIETELARRGNVMADGRPTFGLSAKDLAILILNISPRALIVPAHIWTPHFSLYGSESGFDSIEECFGEMAKYIYAVETGLSSDPAMNWRIKELDSRSIISCSDAHSGAKVGREATVFTFNENEISNTKSQDLNISYEDIRKAIIGEEGKLRISYTIEFYPEEGKYHFSGHRNCGVRQSPEETRRLGETCPVCGKRLTIGVMHRVEKLANRSPKGQISNDKFGVSWIRNEDQISRPPYVMLVPLLEILSESFNSNIESLKVIYEYKKLTENFGGEIKVLMETEIEEIAKISGSKVAEGIKKVRAGDIVFEPGYDGVYGVIKIWPEKNEEEEKEEKKEQLALF